MAKHIVEKKAATEAQILSIGAAGDACPGMLYRSTDTGKWWFGNQDGSLAGPIPFGDSLIVEGSYPDDEAAGTGGVEVGKYYSLTAINNYSLPEGLVMKRTE